MVELAQRAAPVAAPETDPDSTDQLSADPPADSVATVGGFRRFVYWILAGVFFALGMVGVVLPGIPTTPFLLLMCFFLVRVSPAMHAKAMAWPLVGVPLRDWQEQGGVRLNVKILACTMVSVLVGSTLIWSDLSAFSKLIIFSVAVCGVSVVIRLPRARHGGIANKKSHRF